MFSASTEKENGRDIMAVDSTDIQDLLKNIDLKSIIGSSTMADAGGLGIGGGVLGAVLVGALLPRLLGDTNGTAAALAAENVLSASDVQNIVTSAQNSQTLGNIEGEIWKAEGQLQAALAASTNAAQIATLNSEIANLQGQGVIVKAVTEGAAAIAKQGGEGVATTLAAAGNVINAVTTGNAANAAGFGVVNTNLAQLGSLTLQAVNTDGDKTRTAIAALAASIPNARELDLQRQLTVALDNERHGRVIDSVRSGNVDVTTNVNQNQAQSQQQQQIQSISTTLASLVPYVQNIGQSVVNLGTMVASPTAATNVRA